MTTPHPSPETLDAQVAPAFREANPSSLLPSDFERPIGRGGLPLRTAFDRFDQGRIGEPLADTAPITTEAPAQPKPSLSADMVALDGLLHALPREQEPPHEQTRATAVHLGSLLRSLRPGYTSRPANINRPPTDLSRLIKRRSSDPLQHPPVGETAPDPITDKTVELHIVPSTTTYPLTPRSETGPGRHRAEPKRTRPFGSLLRGLRR